jgi:hypothetical protein
MYKIEQLLLRQRAFVSNLNRGGGFTPLDNKHSTGFVLEQIKMYRCQYSSGCAVNNCSGAIYCTILLMLDESDLRRRYTNENNQRITILAAMPWHD